MDAIMEYFINEPLDKWEYFLNHETEIPPLRIGMCGIFGLSMSLILPEDVVDQIVEYLLDAFAE